MPAHTMPATVDPAQASAVAKLIQRFDNSPVTSRASVASVSTLHLSKGAVRQIRVCRSTAAVPRARLVKGKILMKLDFRQRLLTTTLLVGAGMVATPAFAQDDANPSRIRRTPQRDPTTQPETTAPVEGSGVPSTNAQGEPVKSAQDIIVTGSRIPQPNLDFGQPGDGGVQPGSQAFGYDPHRRPRSTRCRRSFADQGSNISNGATGTATIDLRGLGSKRTLVLVNGRRLQPGDPAIRSPDINFIPIQLIKRVDVLTGGASSVYGADAVAGVVNFIMDTPSPASHRRPGERVQPSSTHGRHLVRANTPTQTDASASRLSVPPHGMSTNGGAQDIAGVFGAAFDDGRGHVQAYATYRQQDPVLESTRDYSFCALGSFAAAVAVAGLRRMLLRRFGDLDTGTFRRSVRPARTSTALSTSRRQPVRSRARRCSTSRRTTTSSARTSAIRSARSPTMRSARRSSRTSK